MSNSWLVIFFVSLGMLPIAIVTVFVVKQRNLINSSLYVIGVSILLVGITAGLAYLSGECDFMEAVLMQKRCGTMLLPPKSFLMFYGMTVLGIMMLILSLIKEMVSRNK
jgi:hypothetical protein